MKAKEFEQHCLEGATRREKTGHLTMSRYGVQGTYRKVDAEEHAATMCGCDVPGGGKCKVCGESWKVRIPERWEWRPIESLPDFEGTLGSPAEYFGRQFVFDAKVCSSASFPIHEDKFKDRQLRHMMKRAKFGTICFLLIHFTERKLTKSTVPKRTVAFPIYRDHPFWARHANGEERSINFVHCDEYGVDVPWSSEGRARTDKPDIYDALLTMIGLRDEVVEEKPF